MGVTPMTGPARLDIIPVDYVAKVIEWSSRTEKTTGHVLHECSGPEDALLASDLKRIVQTVFSAAGEKLSKPISVPIWVFKAALPVIAMVAPAKARRALKTLPMLFDYMAENQSFENYKTRKLLDDQHIDQPLAENYLEYILTFYKNAGKKQY